MSHSISAVLFDVDGTVVDSNDAHADAWVKAFAEFGVTVDPIAVRRSIGMGGASSASKADLLPLLAIAGAKGLLDDWTSSDDADESKPAPDIIEAALERAGARPANAIMIGDTPYDIAAARQAGVRVIAFRSGGWLDPDLTGAIEIYDGPWDLLACLDRSSLA